MQLVKAVVSKSKKELVLGELSGIPDAEGVSAIDIINFRKGGKSYIYRGKEIKSSALVSDEQTEISCFSERNTEKIKRIFSEYTGNIYSVSLSSAHNIIPVQDMANRDIKVGFVIPAMNENILPIYSEISSRGYGVDMLQSVPLSIAALIPYDILIIDMSAKKIEQEQLASLVEIPVNIPLVLINRSDNPIDKLSFLKMGFNSIHSIKNTDIILESIYSAISHYRESKTEKISRHSTIRPEDKFIVVFSAFA